MRERKVIWRVMVGTLVVLAAALTGCAAVNAEVQALEPAARLEPEAIPAVEAEPEPEPETQPEPEAVEIAYSQHTAYIQGEDGYFFPDQRLTRAQAAQLLVNLFQPSAADPPQFADVPADTWYAPSVAAASELLPGYADGSFAPLQGVTRVELLEALCRGLELDLPEGENAGMEIAAARGWVEETADPAQPITRAEAVTLMNRALERTPDTETAAGIAARIFLDVDADILECRLYNDKRF